MWEKEGWETQAGARETKKVAEGRMREETVGKEENEPLPWSEHFAAGAEDSVWRGDTKEIKSELESSVDSPGDLGQDSH